MLNVQSLTQRTFAQIVVFALLLLNSTLAFAQNQVNGIVTDKTGEPLIGVNVVEKGTTNGVITDFNGQFTLNVAQGKTLVFSYVGYTTQEITVKGSSLKIIMEEDSKTLDEVVVVGYGSMSRKDVTSSITTVKADKLNVGVYSDPGQLLQGKVPGLTVVQSSDPTSGTASISLRGAQQMDGVTVDVDNFEFTITDDNGLMNYDNKLLKDETLTYYPYYRAQGSTDMDTKGARAEGDTEDSNISVAIAQITVGRLMVDQNPRLSITNKDTGETVLSIPLVKYLLLTEAEGHDMTQQEYLDRQDEYNMTFFLDENMKWINTSIIINDWVVRFNEMDM